MKSMEAFNVLKSTLIKDKKKILTKSGEDALKNFTPEY